MVCGLHFCRTGRFRRDDPLDPTAGLSRSERYRDQRPGVRQGYFLLSARLALVRRRGRHRHQPAYRLRWSGRRSLRVIDTIDAGSRAESETIWRGWLRQGMALVALFCVAMGAARFLGRYHLVINGHSTVVAGGSYADIYFWVPAYDVIIVCWFAAALILALAAAAPRLGNWLVMRPSRWVLPCGFFSDGCWRSEAADFSPCRRLR